MKSVFKSTLSYSWIWGLFCVLLLFSCKAEIKTVTYTSPEKSVELNFTGKRSTSLDPWMVSINVVGYGHDETISTELYSNDISKEVIVVVWENENKASLVLKQRDGENKNMSLSINKDMVQLR